ncbi:MAG: hypothetical protein LC742_02540 [Acidobacteria bacterium]|nr:hypothetical protein [Acidobacteriota bacterium]
MKTAISVMKKLIYFASAIVFTATLAAAQQQPPSAAKLQTDNLERLATKASQVVEVNIDERMLRLVPIDWLKKSSDKDEQLAAQLLKELTLVNIVGNVDMEKLSRLEGRFGIPELNIGRDRDDEDEPETKPAKKP